MRRPILSCLAALVLSLVPIKASADFRQRAAYVVDLFSEGGAISLRQQDGRVEPVGLGQPLYAGDLLVATEGARLVVDDGSGPRTINAKNSPYTVPPARAAGALLGKLRQVMEIIRWQAQPSTISARTRDGGSVAVPMLEGPRVRVFQGRRTLHVGWIDGIPPFRCEVTVDGKVVAETSPTEGRWAEIFVDLLPGEAMMQVTSADGTKAFRFEVAATTGEPPRPAGRALERIERALELSRREGGAYLFEAVQVLSSDGASGAEHALREAIRIGERP